MTESGLSRCLLRVESGNSHQAGKRTFSAEPRFLLVQFAKWPCWIAGEARSELVVFLEQLFLGDLAVGHLGLVEPQSSGLGGGARIWDFRRVVSRYDKLACTTPQP